MCAAGFIDDHNNPSRGFDMSDFVKFSPGFKACNGWAYSGNLGAGVMGVCVRAHSQACSSVFCPFAACFLSLHLTPWSGSY